MDVGIDGVVIHDVVEGLQGLGELVVAHVLRAGVGPPLQRVGREQGEQRVLIGVAAGDVLCVVGFLIDVVGLGAPQLDTKLVVLFKQMARQLAAVNAVQQLFGLTEQPGRDEREDQRLLRLDDAVVVELLLCNAETGHAVVAGGVVAVALVLVVEGVVQVEQVGAGALLSLGELLLQRVDAAEALLVVLVAMGQALVELVEPVLHCILGMQLSCVDNAAYEDGEQGVEEGLTSVKILRNYVA